MWSVSAALLGLGSKSERRQVHWEDGKDGSPRPGGRETGGGAVNGRSLVHSDKTLRLKAQRDSRGSEHSLRYVAAMNHSKV
jgi:hypothetical protein